MAPARLQSTYDLLRTYLPDHDRALISRDAILTYLHSTLQLRRPSGRRLSWRIVLRWHRDAGCPLLRGGWNPRARCLQPPLTTTFALTAWTLSRFDTASRRSLFSVCMPSGVTKVGKARRRSGADAIRDRLAA